MHYGVDWICAIKKLELLGVDLNPVHVQQLRPREGPDSQGLLRRNLELSYKAGDRVHGSRPRQLEAAIQRPCRA